MLYDFRAFNDCCIYSRWCIKSDKEAEWLLFDSDIRFNVEPLSVSWINTWTIEKNEGFDTFISKNFTDSELLSQNIILNSVANNFQT